MTDNTTDFFDGVGGGSGAPGALLKNIGDSVTGDIVEMFKRDYVPFANRKTREPARNENGSPVQQLVVILQTEHRNWANVSSVPKVDPTDPNSAEKAPSEDDGKRAIYVPAGKNIQFAIGRAVQASGSPFEVGGKLRVSVKDLKDVGQASPMKDHEALYRGKPDGFVTQGTTPAPAAQAPAAQAPAAQAAPAPQAPASQDPWGTSAPAAPTSEPPF